MMSAFITKANEGDSVIHVNDTIILDSFLLVKADNDSIIDTLALPFDSNFIDSNGIKVAFVLPLYIDSNQIEHLTTPLYKKAKASIPYLEGAIIAIDSLRALGHKIEYSVYDTYNDSMQVDSIIKDSSIYEHEMVFGPLYNKNFTQLSKHLFPHGIDMISPLSSSTITMGEHYLKNTPSLINHADYMFEHIDSTYGDKTLYIFRKEMANKEEKLFLNRYKNLDSTIIVQDDKITWEMMKAAIDTNNIDSHYVFLIPIASESGAYHIFTQLRQLQQHTEDSLNITVYGTPHWFNFKSVNVNFYKNFNVIFSSNNWYQTESSNSQVFANDYFEKFRTYPNKYAISGFEHAFYYIQYNLLSQGNMGRYTFEWEGLSNKYSLSANKGMNANKESIIINYENQNLHLIEFNLEGIRKINQLPEAK